MRPRMVELEIGELVLQGLPDIDRDRLVRVMERELADLVIGGVLEENAGKELEEIRAVPIKVGVHNNEETIGADIARMVFREINTPVVGKHPVVRGGIRR